MLAVRAHGRVPKESDCPSDEVFTDEWTLADAYEGFRCKKANELLVLKQDPQLMKC